MLYFLGRDSMIPKGTYISPQKFDIPILKASCLTAAVLLQGEQRSLHGAHIQLPKILLPPSALLSCNCVPLNTSCRKWYEVKLIAQTHSYFFPTCLFSCTRHTFLWLFTIFSLSVHSFLKQNTVLISTSQF